MKRWKIGIVAAVAALCLSGALAGCQSQNYAPEEKQQTVAASALGKAGTLRVGVNATSAPLAGQASSSSRIVGIDVDVAAYLADQMGVKVEIVDVGNDPATALSGGNVDMVLGVDASETNATYWRSDSYLQTGVALFGTQDETAVPTVDSKPKIAAQASSRSSWRVTNLFGDESLVSQNDLKSAFEALDKGSVDYVAADAVIGTYVAHFNGFDDKIVALLQDPSGYCAAVGEKNTELQAAVSGAMDKLVDGGVIDVIEKKWLGAVVDLDSVTVVKAPSNEAVKNASATAAAGAEDGSATEGAEGETPETPVDGEAADGASEADAAASADETVDEAPPEDAAA